MFRSRYCVSLCCSVYCLCVNVYCTATTGCQPNFSKRIYRIKQSNSPSPTSFYFLSIMDEERRDCTQNYFRYIHAGTRKHQSLSVQCDIQWPFGSHLEGSLKMGQKGCPETSVRNYHPTLRKNPKRKQYMDTFIKLSYIYLVSKYKCLFKYFFF